MDSTVMVRTIDNASVVTVIGDVDIHTAAALLDTISPLIGSGKRVIVDLTGVGFLDSSGLSVFVTALKRAKEKNARIALVITDPRVLKVFTITGLDTLIDIHESADSINFA